MTSIQNRGYRIILKSGWNESKGLGLSESDLKYLVKNILNKTKKILENMKDQMLLLNYLQKVEEKAGEILTDRQEIVALDKRRNDDRVGMRAIQKQNQKNCWLTLGPILIKMTVKDVTELLVQDQKECDIAINKMRSDLKIKVNEIRDLEREPPVPGLMLKPLSHSEMSAINHLIGRS